MSGIIWERDTIAVQYSGITSAKINNLINTNYGQIVALVFPNIYLNSFTGIPYLSFRWAYAKSDINYSDELSVQISIDCGENFSQIFYRTGNAMATVPVQTTPYIPDSTTVWKMANISLAAYDTSDHAIIKINNVTDGGNNLYIDNINIGNSATVGILENNSEANSFLIFPNPVMAELVLRSDNELRKTELTILNVLGERILYKFISAIDDFKIDVSQLSSGFYFAQLKSNNYFSVQRFIKN